LNILQKINNFFWGPPIYFLVVPMILIGFFLSLYFHFPQFRFFFKMKEQRKKQDSKSKELTPFQTFSLALSTTLGTGTIVGVGLAISSGGAGAIFWMMVESFLAMGIKYAEGYYATLYQKENQVGVFCYLEHSSMRLGRKLSFFYAFMVLISSLIGIGTFPQIQSVVSISTYLYPKSSFYFLIEMILLFIAIIYALFGDTKRIGKITSIILPIMGAFYLFLCFLLILHPVVSLKECIECIFKDCFSKKAILSGTVLTAIQQGFTRSVFSNEAGLGTSGLALTDTCEKNPSQNGKLGMLQTFCGSILLTFITGLALLSSGFNEITSSSGLSAMVDAFGKNIISSDFSKIVLFFVLILFSYTTIVGWSYYGKLSLSFLTKGSQIIQKLYPIVFLLFLLFGIFVPIEVTFLFADIANAFLAIPNLVSLVLLSFGDLTKVLKFRKNTSFFSCKNKKDKV
jgi:AGCS family alanine or glycine:cation symporter